MDVSGDASEAVGGTGLAPQALLDAVIETSDDAIVICDALETVTMWNETAERLFGVKADDIVGHPLGVLFPEHLRDEVHVVLVTVLVGDRVKHFETELVRPDGMPVPVSLSLCPIFDAGRTPVGTIVIARDITEQRLAQATLAEVEIHLQEAEALAHVGSWLWDLRTGAVQWSTEFHRIHGIDPLDFDGTFDSHIETVHRDDCQRVRAGMEESVASGRAFEDEYRVVRPDGQVRVVHARARPTIGSAGRAVGLRGIGQDVTDPAGRFSPGSPGA